MKILLTNQFFANLTGSEMSTYELAKELVNRGHEVVVLTSQLSKMMTAKAIGAGFIATTNPELFQPDIMHLCHKPISEVALKLYPNVLAVQHVRSEVIPVYEVPVIHDNIKAYISIRPSITEYIKSYGIPESKIVHVDNGFDFERFYPNHDIEFEDAVLFVGSVDYLREKMLWDLVNYTNTTKKELWIAGGGDADRIERLSNVNHVKYLGIQSNPEDYIRKAEYCASIFHGRTAIESWLCDVPCWIYDVDRQGRIKSKKLVHPPEDIIKYSIEYHTDKILYLYQQIKSENSEV